MTKYLLGLVTVLSLMCACSSLGDPIVIFGNDEKPPKNYLENDQPIGILIEIMQYADQRLPQSFEYRLYPWNRAYRNTLEAKGGLIGLSMNNDRLKIFDYSEVMYYEELLLVVLKGNEFPYADIDDLSGKRVGYLRGASYGEDFEESRKNKVFQIDEDSSQRQRLLKLLHGRIEVAIIGPGKFALDRAIEGDIRLQRARNQFVILPEPLKRDPNYLGFAKSMDMKGFLNQFNAVLQEGYDSGELQRIIEKKR